MMRLLRKELPFAIGIPAVVWQALFCILPLLMLFSIGMRSPEAYTIVLSMLYAKVIGYSLFLATVTMGICLGVAYPIAYLLVTRFYRWRQLFLFFLMVPFWTNFLLHMFAWYFVLEREGVLNTALRAFGMPTVSLLNTPVAVIIMMVYYYVPFALLPLQSALERVDWRLREASLDLGASWWQSMRSVVIPLTQGGIISAALLVFVPAFGEFAIPELMGGDRFMVVGTVVSYYLLTARTPEIGIAFTVVSATILAGAAFGIVRLIRFGIRWGMQ
jgi:spermidine/putrescine transport system permease protein